MSNLRQTTKRVLYLVALASVCVIAFSALWLTTRASASTDPLQGISAAENAPVLPSNSPALAQINDPSGMFGEILSSVHQLPSTIAGHAAYVTPTTHGGFCLTVVQLGGACDSSFTPSAEPVLFVESDPDGPGPIGTTAFGVAEDGVDSITMTVNGSQVTTAVKENTFQYVGGTSVAPGSITNVSANFTDGHSVPLN